jgi:hypothetical protein
MISTFSSVVIVGGRLIGAGFAESEVLEEVWVDLEPSEAGAFSGRTLAFEEETWLPRFETRGGDRLGVGSETQGGKTLGTKERLCGDKASSDDGIRLGGGMLA